MTNTSLNKSLLAVLGLLALTSAAPTGEQPYFSIEKSAATVYYDMTNTDACGAVFGNNWSVTTGMTGPNAQPPACEWTRGKTLSEIGSATPIAFNHLLVDNDLLNWCGRIVNIYKADGTQYTMNGEPFFIWDGCGDCAIKDRVDLSSEALIGLQDHSTGTSGCDNPEGLRVEVTNDYHWKLLDGGEVNENPTEADRGTGTFVGPIPTAVTHSGPSAAGGASATAAGAGGASSPTQVLPLTSAAAATDTLNGAASIVTSVPAISSVLASVQPTSIPPQVSASAPLGATTAPGSLPPVGSGSATLPGGYGPPSSIPAGILTSAPVPGVNAFAEGSDSSSSASAQATDAASASVGSTVLGSAANDVASAATSVIPPVGSLDVGDGNATSSDSAGVGSEIPNSEESDCEPGTYSCNGLELRICGNIQAGTAKVGKLLTSRTIPAYVIALKAAN
uniref:Uncharacterized protein n=1 Tax=Kwoniella dejecticola CBS 10117 TaxID=1296121 RepID=A0A1A6A450_9TREE|nr:uncharacterized protein I303_04155 [Kwoniella dejecticola CBS 10117]OBR84834.1 hypothetical protein I303_04155 [Kwoniella dejecticola CBS 10117]